jgi:hypothetical protein
VLAATGLAEEGRETVIVVTGRVGQSTIRLGKGSRKHDISRQHVYQKTLARESLR